MCQSPCEAARCNPAIGPSAAAGRTAPSGSAQPAPANRPARPEEDLAVHPGRKLGQSKPTLRRGAMSTGSDGQKLLTCGVTNGNGRSRQTSSPLVSAQEKARRQLLHNRECDGRRVCHSTRRCRNDNLVCPRRSTSCRVGLWRSRVPSPYRATSNQAPRCQQQHRQK